jgi:hypothetical protein
MTLLPDDDADRRRALKAVALDVPARFAEDVVARRRRQSCAPSDSRS